MKKGKYKMVWAILIDGNFMQGRVYTKTKEEAYSKLKEEVLNGFQKLKKEEECRSYNKVYWTMDKEDLIGIDGLVGERLAWADDYESYITYKVRKVRVPV